MAKYYLVGELHGTNECPRAFLDIVSHHHITQIALEFDKSKQHEVDAFLEGKRSLKDLSIFKVTEPHDGRASPAVQTLLHKAKERSFRVYLVDDSSRPQHREAEMAKNIMSIKGTVAYLCGNVHAAKGPIQLEKSSEFFDQYKDGLIRTCGSLLPEQDTVAYNIVALHGGEFYNLKVKKEKEHPEFARLPKIPATVKSKDPNYDFLYVVNRFTVSKW